MFKLILPLLLFFALNASEFSDYQRSLNAASQEFSDFDCDFEDCSKKRPTKPHPKPVTPTRTTAPTAQHQNQPTKEPQRQKESVQQTQFSSCLALKQAQPDAATGYYTLLINNRSYKAYCEMSIEGGGWTRVWVADRSDYNKQIFDYDLPFALIEKSTRTFISFEKNGRELDAYSFTTPPEWKVQHPLSYENRLIKIDTFDVYTNKEYRNRTLYYGYQNYASTCQNRFNGGKYGKVCITDTNAPFFTGYNRHGQDYCNRSLERYNTTYCDNKRFAIFMK